MNFSLPHDDERFEEGRALQFDLSNYQLFLSAPIPIMVEDWSRVYQAIMDLRHSGIADLDVWFGSHPQAVADLRALHSFVEANDAVVELFEAGTKAAFFERAKQLLPADRTSNIAVYRAMFEGRDACQGERTLVTFSGKRVPIVWRCSLPKHEDGYRRLCFYGFDVTAQKESNDRMQAMRAEMARSARVSLFGEVAASILHEISQPLSATRTSADAALRWLQDDSPNIGQATEAIRDSARWARDATEICKKIRGFLGKVPVHSVLSSASGVVEAATFLISSEAKSKAVFIDRRLDADLSIFADPLQIQQVLANLLLNGVHAIDSAEGGERRLTVAASRTSSDEALFEVRDSGTGMTEETLSSLFQPFFTTKSSGMGMGLVVARSIVEAHGGRIWVESKLGFGTSFFFSLPISESLGATR
ncbi:sensor histidine kinase [Paraburkholderia unamae]|uniref:histidine kinase n=1 Tax=Paraburkholderia unamae TaxID=219649 RepID=A0ABX5KRW2_9BURK|nr:ATP-binding protein [Paraburkholderia unamae]PVX83654.1 histidine kinase/DNA gyrase B/HSP90-like ATPase [Paraburkholderia unamae]RAR63801.1 histidine kinase/DNA gyrase B/HSP90-like ATPase [Paraburkholderia unamae]